MSKAEQDMPPALHEMARALFDSTGGDCDVTAEEMRPVYEVAVADLTLQLAEVTRERDALRPREVTPAMLRAAQTSTELGAHACANLSGAYGLITELYQRMFDAAPQPAEAKEPK